MSKVLLINGSPNEHGCTYTALCEVAASLEKNGIETEILYLGKAPVPGCIACGRCRRDGLCSFGGQVNDIIKRIDEFDGIVAGSPVYYAAASGQITSFMDRLFYAAGSAVFAALQSILGKVGVQDMDSTLATALRTVVVLVFAWAIVLVKKEGGDWKKMTRRDAVLLVLSGITTGASWLCYYRALQTGRASVVVPIDKCSMLFAVALSAIFLKEKQTRRSLLALALVVAGTFMIALA